MSLKQLYRQTGSIVDHTISVNDQNVESVVIHILEDMVECLQEWGYETVEEAYAKINETTDLISSIKDYIGQPVEEDQISPNDMYCWIFDHLEDLEVSKHDDDPEEKIELWRKEVRKFGRQKFGERETRPIQKEKRQMKYLVTLRCEIAVQVEVDPEDVEIVKNEMGEYDASLRAEDFPSQVTAFRVVSGEITDAIDKIKIKGTDFDCGFTEEWSAEKIEE